MLNYHIVITRKIINNVERYDNEEDIRKLVDAFYYKVKFNAQLNPIFSDVAKVEWEHHLSKMYDFWSSILLGKSVYKGNPIPKHIDLNFRIKLTPELFNEWLTLFSQTVDELFSRDLAEEAKNRAVKIAEIIHHKIELDDKIIRLL